MFPQFKVSYNGNTAKVLHINDAPFVSRLDVSRILTYTTDEAGLGIFAPFNSETFYVGGLSFVVNFGLELDWDTLSPTETLTEIARRVKLVRDSNPLLMSSKEENSITI